MKKFNTPSEAYMGVLDDVWNNYNFVSTPRGLEVREILNYSFEVSNPSSAAIKTRSDKRNKVIAEYHKKETDLYLSGSNKVEDFATASTFWNNIANPDGTINSAYGYLLWKNKSCFNKDFSSASEAVSPWEWAKQSLLTDKHTRQAIIRFNLPEHCWEGNKDFPCTLTGTFHIRENKLYLSMVMRSTDLTRGLVYDLPFFILLQEMMLDELKAKYPDLTLGSYYHLSHSMHVYSRDIDKVNDMLDIEDTDCPTTDGMF